ncbi:hypothetical protein B0H17DRAFT_1099245 [Mycena rosella]|uniref:Pheromone n=1 Tax=Mycena rosella TaxID=1033263 RepID=A0AAD7CNN7_MYCRO|nr:hypothetical protein B0H17DRAFT_1099245 [Mycena rosella]
MRLLSAFYVSYLFSLTVFAAPLNHTPGGAIAEIPREDHDSPVPAAHMSGDVFEKLDLTARESDVEDNLSDTNTFFEDPALRTAQTTGSGCVIA